MVEDGSGGVGSGNPVGGGGSDLRGRGVDSCHYHCQGVILSEGQSLGVAQGYNFFCEVDGEGSGGGDSLVGDIS